MCHPLPLTGIDITFALSDSPCMVEIKDAVTCTGDTGVEMEALTAVSVAALTIYDMCKAVQKDMRIENIRLLSKSGGKSGDYQIKECACWLTWYRARSASGRGSRSTPSRKSN